MANLLYLVHRIPYPPNKGDKVHSYHLLRHLAASHRVFLGTFVDDPRDEEHIPVLRALCTEVEAVPLRPSAARAASLGGLLTGSALTLHYYRSRRLSAWIDSLCARTRIDAVVVFSSPMAQYVERRRDLPMLVDLVDVDSAKWTEFAAAHRWPMSWLYRREGARLLAYERRIVAQSSRSFLVTPREVELFNRLAPECAGRVQVLGNGVNSDYFAPAPGRASPFVAGGRTLVFTGAMDYWPNIDAVCWFAKQVLPRLRTRWPELRFAIVGRDPAPAVQQLAGPQVEVTGAVDDVRPYLQHADVVVAPLRLARGVQNKVLEAMAMGRPVVASSDCVEALDARSGIELESASTEDDYLDAIDALLGDRERAAALGRAARRCIELHYSWTARLAPIDRCLNAVDCGTAAPSPGPRHIAMPTPP